MFVSEMGIPGAPPRSCSHVPSRAVRAAPLVTAYQPGKDSLQLIRSLTGLRGRFDTFYSLLSFHFLAIPARSNLTTSPRFASATTAAPGNRNDSPIRDDIEGTFTDSIIQRQHVFHRPIAFQR